MTSDPTTILCIDDDHQTLHLRKQVLEMQGYRVMIALSGESGLQVLEEEQTVDLVLLDYAMPGMGGDRVAQELKRRHPQLPILLISGFPELPEALLAMVDGHVKKGQDPEVVVNAIRKVLETGHQLRF